MCDDPLPPVAANVMCFDIPTTSHHRARLEAVFEPAQMPDGWTCQLLDAATHVAA